METASLYSTTLAPLSLPSSKPPCEKTRFVQGRRSNGKVFATRGENYGGQLVDENMIVLRKRIHEMIMKERNYEPPQEWMGWEKQYYTCYDEYICKFVGLLQSHLMNSRPSLALGMLALITISVPASTVMIALRLMEAAEGALSMIHLG
ncbi:hypothetical protein CFOL_v3_19297 [Cephalotus follicularis]|uniref:Uncharacterized protein n=1 Tax=Cephalotus follicularis TaxID=3775 RepID=A0A1Q3C6U2_CEPFO|nr:hypothetical protein CFOL_v3_19297 [Cephalotus follicularis]